jgi:hypothetical protein
MGIPKNNGNVKQLSPAFDVFGFSHGRYLPAIIAHIWRNMPRNADVMAVCDELERLRRVVNPTVNTSTIG